jgi:hypothetical protein
MLRRVTAAALTCAAVALSACGSTSDPATDFHAGFMDSCTGKGTAQSMCQCFYDKLVARYTPDQAMRRIQAGQLTREEMTELSQPCLAGAAG